MFKNKSLKNWFFSLKSQHEPCFDSDLWSSKLNSRFSRYFAICHYVKLCYTHLERAISGRIGQPRNVPPYTVLLMSLHWEGGTSMFFLLPPFTLPPSSLPTIFCCPVSTLLSSFRFLSPTSPSVIFFQGKSLFPSDLPLAPCPLWLVQARYSVGPRNRQGPLPSPPVSRWSNVCWDSRPTLGLAGEPQGCPAEGDIPDGIQSTKDLLVTWAGVTCPQLTPAKTYVYPKKVQSEVL